MIVTYMPVFLPKAVGIERCVLGPWFYGNKLSIAKPNLFNNSPH